MEKKREEKKIIIEQDDREPEGLQQFATLVDKEIIFERKRMKRADYRFGKFYIERKTVEDFCASIVDGRINKQIEDGKKLIEEGNFYMVFIIGRVDKKKHNINEHCVLGKICSIVHKHEIPLIMVDNEFQFLYCMKNLYKK